MTNELKRLLESKRRSFEWRTSYAETFTDEARALYNRSAAILFQPMPAYLTDKQVLSVYDHAIKSLEVTL